MNSKQREELQRISAAITVNTIPNGVRTIACTISPEEVKHIVDAILAEPVRNCDVGTPREQYDRCAEYCKAHNHDCRICPLAANKYQYGATCELYWAQMPYETVKTKNKGE